jgi:hypothetical protein
MQNYSKYNIQDGLFTVIIYINYEYLEFRNFGKLQN